jgi:UDP-GlcNAc:undecaprenyl-phosphate GlcNAc-1-phosphate transferase
VYSILFLAAASFCFCLLLTPLVRVASKRRGLLDQPGARKLHASPIPRTGGVAIAGAYLAALGLLVISPMSGASSVKLPLAMQLLPAAGLVFAAGLLDDIVGVRAWEKLAVQVIAAGIAFFSGVQFDGVAGYDLPMWLSLIVTVGWLVGCSNAFNLIDGMDGLATGVGLFATFTIMVAGLLHENVPLALATAPLVGALLAFLRYNFNPASIFLGDSGSLTIGFALGCFGIIWSQKSATLLGMTAPLMALSVPLLDTGVAIVRRFIRRQPIFSADRNHIHHRLLDRGHSPKRVALILYGACSLAAVFSLLQTSYLHGNGTNALLLLTFCLTAWAGIQMVGYAEFDVARSLVVSGAFRDIVHARMFVEKVERQVAAATTPDEYWDAMLEVNREVGCSYVRMMLGGQIYEDVADVPPLDEPNTTLRVELGGSGYVNFSLGETSSMRHGLAVLSVVNIFQRSLAKKPVLPFVRAAEPFSQWVPATDTAVPARQETFV